METTDIIKAEVIETSSLQLVARAEIDSQISTAKQYPRSLQAVKKSMLEFATLDQETAESCFYSLPRGDKNIQGPSVRLAEIAVSCFQNLRAGARVISTVTNGENPHVIIQAVCHDLQNNVAVTIEKRRRIVGKKKNAGKVDEDDINLATNACAAIAFRDAVFKVIPGALIKPVYEQAVKVAIGDAKSLGDRRNVALDKFTKIGVSKERVLAKLERKSVEEITLENLETMFGLFSAIKDQQTTIDEAFPTGPAKPKFDEAALASKLTGRKADDDVPMTGGTPLASLPAEAPKLSPQAENERFMTSQSVAFDDYRSFVQIKNIAKDTDSWTTWDEVPAAVITALDAQPKTKAALIKTFGKVA